MSVETYEQRHGMNTHATMQLLREAAAWASRAGHDEISALGFGRWYVRCTDGLRPLAAALSEWESL